MLAVLGMVQRINLFSFTFWWVDMKGLCTGATVHPPCES